MKKKAKNKPSKGLTCPKCQGKKVQDYGVKFHPRFFCSCGQGFDLKDLK